MVWALKATDPYEPSAPVIQLGPSQFKPKFVSGRCFTVSKIIEAHECASDGPQDRISQSVLRAS